MSQILINAEPEKTPAGDGCGCVKGFHLKKALLGKYVGVFCSEVSKFKQMSKDWTDIQVNVE